MWNDLNKFTGRYSQDRVEFYFSWCIIDLHANQENYTQIWLLNFLLYNNKISYGII